MHARVAHQPFQLKRRVDQLTHLYLILVGLLQWRGIVQGLVQGDVQRGRHHFGNAVHVGIGNVHGAAHVFDGCFGRHSAEGDDLGHVFAAVFLGDVIDHLAAPVHAEINVDIGQRNALRVQEALKQQLVLQRIDIGDAHGVSHQRACG